MQKLENYITGKWITGDGEGQELFNAVTGEPVAAASTKGLDLLPSPTMHGQLETQPYAK
jgi:oxepin-CoA hydrolase/3-oxo-5,6-dehydrosuberyl-CoA semialdehyde dehydrogenase